MASDAKRRGRVEVGPGDIVITESGGVEIVNRQLADELKALLEEEGGSRAASAPRPNPNCLSVNAAQCPPRPD